MMLNSAPMPCASGDRDQQGLAAKRQRGLPLRKARRSGLWTPRLPWEGWRTNAWRWEAPAISRSSG
eukprot:7230899-Alexandrium_andersonii.AAC.1